MNFRSSPGSLLALCLAVDKGLGLLVPPPALTVSQWADRYAVLPAGSAEPGRWVTATAEYQRGIMDAFTDPLIENIVLMMGAQTGKSASMLNAIGYYTDQDPSHVMLVQPTIDDAEKFSKDRVAKMIDQTPRLKPLFASPRTRDSNNTLLHKEFPGGFIRIPGANAPAGLASTPIRILLCDEVDKYPVSAGTEGDPVELARKRTTNYWNRKICLASTPNIKNESRIEAAFDGSDQRYFFVPCPHCDEFQVLRWDKLEWPSVEKGAPKTDPEACYYVCSKYGCVIAESEKFEMVRAGKWIATAESLDGKTAGFHVNALYSPWASWSSLINEFLQATRVVKEQHNTELLKTFINARLAETWELMGTKADESELSKHTQDYEAEVPAGALVLTAGGDVQGDRVEIEVVGWGANGASWSIAYKVFRGNPGLQQLWKEVDAFLLQKWQHESGIMLPIRAAFIDSGGHHTKQVYDFTRKRATRWVFASKGSNEPAAPLTPPRANIVGKNTRTPLWMIGTHAAKESIYSSFGVVVPGDAGYCAFPSAVRQADGSLKAQPEYNRDYFLMLTAEVLTEEKQPNGTFKRRWKKIRERNEALDCRVGALAALDALKPNFKAIAANFQKRVEAKKQTKKGAKPRGMNAPGNYATDWMR